LATGGDLLAVALDREGLAELEAALLDLEELVALGGLEDVGVAGAQHLAVDVEDAIAVLVLHPEVVAERDELLADQEVGHIGRIPARRAAQPQRSRAAP
jgi:hypothetical protein